VASAWGTNRRHLLSEGLLQNSDEESYNVVLAPQSRISKVLFRIFAKKPIIALESVHFSFICSQTNPFRFIASSVRVRLSDFKIGRSEDLGACTSR
jgi:hypothetical protein